MYVLVTYDVSTTTSEGRRRLRKVASTCQDYGQRVQNSVFELSVDPAQWADCKHKLQEVASEQDDSLRFYYLGRNWHRRVEHWGAKPTLDFDQGPLIV